MTKLQLLLAVLGVLCLAASGFITLIRRFSRTPSRTRPTEIREDALSFSDRMESLSPGTRLAFRDPFSGSVSLRVVTCETFFGRKQYKGSSEWIRSHLDEDVWNAVLCAADSRTSSQVLILRRQWGTYVLNRRRSARPEELQLVREYGKQFAAAHQQRGSVVFRLGDEECSIDDIGVYDVEGGHLPSGILARFLLGQTDRGMAILIEDGQGDEHNYIWSGFFARDVNDVIQIT